MRWTGRSLDTQMDEQIDGRLGGLRSGLGGWIDAWMRYLELATYTRIRKKTYVPVDILASIIAFSNSLPCSETRKISAVILETTGPWATRRP